MSAPAVHPPIRLLAIDIDGTLVNSEVQIPPANVAALERAHQRGVEIVLVTGRRHMFALPIAQQAGVPLWLISSNGAVTQSLDGKLFHIDYLPLETALRVCKHMNEFRGQMVITFDKTTKGALVIESRAGFHPGIGRWMAKNEEFIETVAPIERALTCAPIQAMFCGGVELMRRAVARLESGDLARDITILRTEYPHRDLSIVDVLHHTCSKGAAVARWAEHRGFRREEVMAIGDNFNDLEMLRFAGRPFLMGNACAELKANGWTCVPSNDENGVAAAIEQAIG